MNLSLTKLTQTNPKEKTMSVSAACPNQLDWIETPPYASFTILMRTSYWEPTEKLTDLRTHRQCGLSHEDESWVMKTPAPRRGVPMLTEIDSCTWSLHQSNR